MGDPTIVDVRAAAWNVELTEPFGIATGAQTVARNALVEVELSDGTIGTGEAAPFPAVNGETQDDAIRGTLGVRDALVGSDPRRLRRISEILREALPGVPSARAALESAVFDAVARRAGISLWHVFGGAEEALETDITIVTGTADDAARAAARAREAGFSRLKIKVGGASLEHDVERFAAIAAEVPSAELLLDANASFTVDEAVELVERVGAAKIALFEQPTPANDLDALRAVRKRARVLVAADESARSAAEVAEIAALRAADVINVKITKCGVVEAWDMIAAARGYRLELMIGGMVETPLAMTVSACLAAGQGGFRFADLDTPLFMKEVPVTGGFDRTGSTLRVSHIRAGHGVTVNRR